MKRLFFLGIALMSAVHVAGQEESIDSLVNVLKTQNLPSREQFALYMKILESTGDSNIISECIRTGLPLARKEKNQSMESVFNEYTGRLYVRKAMFDSALFYFDKALQLAIDSKNIQQENSVYTSYAVAYGFQGMYKELIEYQLKALKISEKTGNKQGIEASLRNIGSAYTAMNDNEHALEYQEKALVLAEEINHSIGIVTAHYAIASTHFNLRNFEEAEKHLLTALDMVRQLHGNQTMTSFILIALQEVYCEGIVDLEKAEMYGKEGLEIAEQSQNPTLKANAYKSFANIYRIQGRYEESDIAASKAWELDSVNMDMGIVITATLTYANIHLGNKQRALQFFDKYYTIVNKYNEKSLHESLASQEVKYETEKKEMRIASLEKEHRLYIGLGAVGGVLAIALGIVLWQKMKNVRKEKQLIATRSILDGEMKERARLAQDLHDRLSGNLSAVKIELNKHADMLQSVREQLDKCIRDIRDAAHNLMPASLQYGTKVALEDFSAQFPNVQFHFFGKEKRIGERLEFVVYCCANELINNAIKHSGAQNINMQLVQDEKHVTLTVSDDGCGFDEQNVTKGFGLKSIRNRVASCNGKIDIDSSPGKGTETTIELKI